MISLMKLAGGLSGLAAMMFLNRVRIRIWRYAAMGGIPESRWRAGIALKWGDAVDVG